MAKIKLQGESEKRKGIYYEVDSDAEPIGEGGTGKVYEGRCINTKTGETKSVAIKFLFVDLSEQIVERARRESSIQLRNDNLIEMLGFIETETTHNNTMQKHYHVVSELLHGVSLTDIFDGKCSDAKGKEIPYAKKLLNIYSNDPDHFAKIVIKNVLSGLMALHDAGYIHRDIDPSNIMITDDNHIKLIDFGICKQMDKLTTHDKVQTVAGVFMGKPEYASPELALGDIKHQDQTTDIYAVGILMYQCVLGHVPFEGTCYEILDKQVKLKIPSQKIKNARLRRIINKACNKKQELRYQTSAEMRVDIESLDIKRAADPRKKRMIFIAIICALIVFLAGLGGTRWYSFHKEADSTALKENKTKVITDSSVKQAYQPTLEELYDVALNKMNSSDIGSLKEGFAVMDSLSNTNYIPAIYQMAFTYGWYSDSISVNRKKMLGIAINKNFLPVSYIYSNMAVALFTRIMELNDSAYADINAMATYRLACYYVISNNNFKTDMDKGKRLLSCSEEWATKAKNKKVLEDIRGLREYIKQQRTK